MRHSWSVPAAAAAANAGVEPATLLPLRGRPTAPHAPPSPGHRLGIAIAALGGPEGVSTFSRKPDRASTAPRA